MTSHVARLYALVVGVVVFFVVWAAVAAHPWAPRPARDPRLVALGAREQRLQRESLQVKRVVEQRWATYRVALRARQAQIATAKRRQAAAQAAHAQAQLTTATPSVRVVNLPPLVVTRTS
jgi:hypothetical protein